jgi:hypothetical protein
VCGQRDAVASSVKRSAKIVNASFLSLTCGTLWRLCSKTSALALVPLVVASAPIGLPLLPIDVLVDLVTLALTITIVACAHTRGY